MSPYECQFILADGVFVWTETYYRLATDSISALRALFDLGSARQQILSQKANVILLRSARLFPRGDVATCSMPSTPNQFHAAHPSEAVFCQLESSSQGDGKSYTTALYLRGCPAKFFPLTPAHKATAVQGYLDAVVSGGWSLRVASRDLRQYPVLGLQRLADVDQDCLGSPLDPGSLPLDQSTVMLSGDFSGLVDDAEKSGLEKPSLRLHGIKWLPHVSLALTGLQGKVRPDMIARGGIFLTATIPLLGQPIEFGKVRLYDFTFPPVTKGTVIGQTKRDTGGRSKYRHSFASVPLAINQLATSIAGFAPSPPTLGKVIPYSGPVDQTVWNAQQVANLVWQGYSPPFPAPNFPIGLYKVLNRESTWLVTASGTDIRTDQATGISEDIQAGLGKLDTFSRALITLVKQNIPAASTLLFAGHSLGGMECQLAAKQLAGSGYNMLGVLNYGSPIVVQLPIGGFFNSFHLNNDPVVYATFARDTLLYPITNPAASFVYLFFFRQLDQADLGYTFPESHVNYPLCDALITYDPGGNPIKGRPLADYSLQLAPPLRFPVVWYYPP